MSPRLSKVSLSGWSAAALAVSVFLTGLGLTAIWRHSLRQSAEAEDYSRFTRQVDQLQADVATRFRLPHYGMAGLRASVAAAGGALSRDGFRDYVEARNLKTEFPGVRGFAFVERVPRLAVPLMEAAERAGGVSSFTVRSSGSAAELYVVRYIEPLGHNAEALGLDLGWERLRRQAIERAIDSGEPVLTAPISLVQDQRRSPGFLYLLPLYRHGSDPSTAEQRRTALLGLLYTPIVVAELMAGTAKLESEGVDFRLLAQAGASGPVVVFDSSRALANTTGEPPTQSYVDRHFTASRRLTVGQQQLELQVASTATFERASDARASWTVGVGGVLLSTLLAATLWLLARGRARAVAAAEAMTADLDRLAKVAQRTSNAVIITDKERRVVWVNEGFTRISGYTLDEFKGRVPGHLLQTENTDAKTVRAIGEQLGRGTGFRTEICNRSKDGRDYWVDIDVQPLHDARGQLTGFMAVETDITEMRSARMHLERLAREQAVMLDSDLVGIVKLRDRVSVWSNRGLGLMFGYSEEELRGAPARLLYLDDESYAALGAAAYPVLSNGGTYRTQLQMRHRSGSPIWVDLSGVRVSTDPDESMWLMVDITALKQHQLAMERAALYDALTGLPNRTLLQDRLSQALTGAGRRGQALAVAYMDLDGFKAVNDTHGHDAGDAVLCAVGERLHATLRESDTVARLGGDEFVFVLSPAGTDREVAEVLRRVQAAIGQPVPLPSGAHAMVGASIGVARYPEDGNEAAILLTLADERMFREKRLRHRSYDRETVAVAVR
ncbi:sensor domain-containing diguanylate cyclase [Rubrivivax sp. RP6-9]|uniref:sensor domain-containing diguanylate cyclase n=1 Tax=Rubrivivax sp. RP6-9 TaxID=3415750 RepID=UPI003CC5B03F